jgi:hypothetical protein
MYAICPPEGGIGIMAKRSMKDSALRIHVTTCVAILLSSNALADPFDTAITIDQLDLEQTAAFKQGEVQALDEKALGDTLDPRSAEGKWSAGGPPNWQMRTFSYRLVFKEPTAIGTMFARLNSQYSKGARFLYLKPGAKFPGDPEKDSDWETIPTTYVKRDTVHAYTFPAGFKTRALLCSESRYLGPSRVREWHLLGARVHNITPECIAQGEMTDGALDPMLVPRGIRSWHSGGPTWPDDRIHRVPVTSVAPSWFLLTRLPKMKPVAMRLRCNATDIKLYTYTGPENANPGLMPEKYWRRLKSSVISETPFPLRGGDNRRLISIDEPLETQAIKVALLETSPKNLQIASVNEWTLWEDIRDADVPAPPDDNVPPPLSIPYSLERDAEVAMAVDYGDGVRARNLIAQVAREGGEQMEPWDLKDEEGFYVQPGTYKVKGIHAPPLQLVYQHTLYPNVEAHSPLSHPWPRGSRGGWLANHANHSAVCAVGDRLFISAGGTEGGHALIETEFSGQKTWGAGHGANRLATDGKSLFLEARQTVSRMDLATRKIERLLSVTNQERKGKLLSMAAHNNRLVLAIGGEIPYFANPTHAGQIDLDACLPKLPEKIKPKTRTYYGMSAYPQDNFLRLFRLKGDPAGLDAAGDLVTIPSTDEASHKQYIVLAFKEPVPIGSVVFPALTGKDYSMQLSVLKPDGDYPPKPGKQSDWIPFEKHAETAWEVLPAPPNVKTRALRIMFSQAGMEDVPDIAKEETGPTFDDMDDLGGEGDDAVLDGLLSGKKWQAQLEGMQILRRRFRNHFSSAKIRVSSGVVDRETGAWDAQRKRVIWTDDPGVYVLEWDEPQDITGLAIKEIDGMKTFVDVYVGPDDEPVDIEEFAQDENTGKKWKCVGLYRQKLRSAAMPSLSRNVLARYIEGFVNFGKTHKTRAVRLRVSEQWRTLRGARRKDQGGSVTDTKRCNVYGVAPLEYIGGEPQTDPLAGRRLVIHDATSGKLLQALPSEIDGDIAFSPSGELFGISDGRIAKIDLQTGKAGKAIVDDMLLPRLVEFDRHGRLYAYDHDESRRIVRVYEPDGEYLHTIGTPGPKLPGPWDPASLGEISAMSVDREDNIWMIYPHENPRRTIHFKTDGTFVKEMLGNTPYGGGGTLDRYDKTRAYFKDVVFKINRESPDKITSHIDSQLSTKLWEVSQYAPLFRQDMVPIMIEGRRYMVNAQLVVQPRQQAGYVYLVDEKTKTMRMVAGVGSCSMGAFFDQDPDMIRHLDGEPLRNLLFIWGDRNGDGKMQVAEVEFEKAPKGYYGLGPFDPDLGIMGETLRYEVKKFLPDGTPIYHRVPVKGPGGFFRLNNGNYFSFSVRGKVDMPWCNAVFTPGGKRLWTYWSSVGVSGLFIPPWDPGKVSNQLGIIGHETAHAGDLGEFLVIHANTGQWNIWTADGLLAGHVTHHARDPRARRFGREYAPGTRLDGMTAGQEHFHGFFCRTVEDDQYYIMAGGNHASIVEVKGLDQFKRFESEITVTPEVLEQTRKWEAERLKKTVFARSPVVDCRSVTPSINGKVGLNEWGDKGVEIWFQTSFNAAFDNRNLYLCWKVMRAGPLKNAANDFRRAFRGGGAVDVQIGVDPDADLQRDEPVEGDMRLLFTTLDDELTATLYRPIAEGASPEEAWEIKTKAGGNVHFDQVKQLKNAVIRSSGGDMYYEVEAEIPLKSIGLKIKKGMVLKLDCGVLFSKNGKTTSDRRYWANSMAVGVPDEAVEARLHPDRWGFIRFLGAKKTLLDELMLDDKEKMKDKDIDDIFDDMEVDI